LRAPVSVAAPGWRGRATPARTSVLVRLGKWPKVIGGVRSWRGIKFDEFSFEVKKCGDGTAAEELMREFLESDGLDQDFCQSAFDTVHLAYRQRRPPEEVALLQDMATTLMRAHREKVQLPEEFLADSLLMSFNTKDPAAAMDGDSAETFASSSLTRASSLVLISCSAAMSVVKVSDCFSMSLLARSREVVISRIACAWTSTVS